MSHLEALELRCPDECSPQYVFTAMHDSVAYGGGVLNTSFTAEMQDEVATACNIKLKRVLQFLNCLTDEFPLKTLALHNLCMPPQHTQDLHSALSSLSGTLVDLHLDLCMATGASTASTRMPGTHSAADGWKFSCGIQKHELFQSLSCLSQLKRLTLPQWVEFVGNDVHAPEPLTRLENLETVHVGKVPELSDVASFWSWKFVALERPL